jgi:hypothetical protein
MGTLRKSRSYIAWRRLYAWSQPLKSEIQIYRIEWLPSQVRQIAATYLCVDCPASNKWHRLGVRLSECFAHQFHV